MTTALSTQATRTIMNTEDAVPLLDTARFEHMQRIATVMARSSLVPDALIKDMSVKEQDKPRLDETRVMANCFLVVNQAVRWGLDPFAVAQSVAVVHGKLCYEGKLVAAVIDAKLGIKLKHYFTGEGDQMRIYLSDAALTDTQIAGLKPNIRYPGTRILDGSVADWKTSGNNSPWSPKNYARMLVYRGSRDWTRIYEPALMLGVYTPDEMDDFRADNAKDITPAKPDLAARLEAAKASTVVQEGFSTAHVATEAATISDTSDVSDVDTTEDVTDPVSVTDPAISPAGETSVTDQTQTDRPQGDTTPSPQSGSLILTDAERADLLSASIRMVASIGPDADIVKAIAQGVAEDFKDRSELLRSKLKSVYTKVLDICRAEEGRDDGISRDDGLSLIAGIVGCEVRDLL